VQSNFRTELETDIIYKRDFFRTLQTQGNVTLRHSPSTITIFTYEI